MEGDERTEAGDEALQRLLDAARVEAAGQARRGARLEAELLVGEATLVGLLREMADQRARVRVELLCGPPFAGQVQAVGRDVVVLGADATVTLVPLSAIALVDAAPLAQPATGDRAASHDVRLVDVLSELSSAGPRGGAGTRVTVWLRGRTDPVRGDLVGAGVDVVLLRGEGSVRPASGWGLGGRGSGGRGSGEPSPWGRAIVTLPVAAVVALRVA